MGWARVLARRRPRRCPEVRPWSCPSRAPPALQPPAGPFGERLGPEPAEYVVGAWQAALVIHLGRPDLHLMDAALRGDDVLAEALGCDVAAGWATFTEALKPTRDAIAASPDGAAWGARFFVAGDPPELVGWGGFKGPPDGGVVELGYEIAESRRGRGIATAATRAMLAEAFSDEAVTAVIAHTRPERNASNHILEKLGFVFDGEVHEDDDVVWRFRLARSDGE
jgi:ribosomal-protein-alanine N-acetyltransferase